MEPTMRTTQVFILCCMLSLIYGHGYMVSPPARNSMWRFGFNNPKNYNDNQLFCGGIRKQIRNGRCGVCGDDASLVNQPHMDGGRYANGIIGKSYRRGSVATIRVLLTANHRGYFEFRIGKFDNRRVEGDNAGKLKGTLLKMSNGETKYQINTSRAGYYTIQVQLPPHLSCKRCVMQWWYRAGNGWGCDKAGCGLGHGNQEHFVNCADISVL